MKTLIIFIVIVILAISLLAFTSLVIAQTAPAKKASSSGPTKVTGEPTKTASGLEYWDIKVGTGAGAQTGHHVKVDYTGWLTAQSSTVRSVAGGRLTSCWAGGRSSRDGTKGSPG